MPRFGAVDSKDRFFGAAVYLLAIRDATMLGAIFALQIPALAPLFDFLQRILLPVNLIYGIFNQAIPFGLGSLVVFFILFIAVVRNEKISYFIRFNTLQSILFGIAVSLVEIVFGQLSLLIFIVAGPVFLLVTGASFYCIAECIMGRYPEIPTISAAVSSQLPR